MKRLIKTASCIVGLAAILYVFADGVLGRFYPKVHTPTKYGWSVPPHQESTQSIQDTKGNQRQVVNRFYAHGFKRWPMAGGDKTRVLVIGDSFTHMVQVANGEEWYAYLERAFPDIAFYVFGGGGYGTLQEYMVLDDHFDEIRPQALFWQFCRNDFHNNSYALDRRDYPYNNHFVRPYLEDNQIVYRLPLPYPDLRRISFTADKLLHLYDRRRFREAVKKPVPHNEQDPDFIQAVAVTRSLAEKVRSRIGGIPVYFFNACGPFAENVRSVCRAGDFTCIDFVDDFVTGLEKSGVQMRVPNDGHWNREGNRRIGEKLVEYFNGNGGLIPGPPAR